MRVVEVRRHSLREPYGDHLSPEGIELAHRTAAALSGMERVVTSEKVRAIETAEALGLHVDRTIRELGQIPDEVQARVDEANPRSFAEYVTLVARNAWVRTFAASQVGLWSAELARVAEGGRLLVVSHGGIIELGAAMAVPEEARKWGIPLSVLEGVRLFWDEERWTRGEILRLGQRSDR